MEEEKPKGLGLKKWIGLGTILGSIALGVAELWPEIRGQHPAPISPPGRSPAAVGEDFGWAPNWRVMTLADEVKEIKQTQRELRTEVRDELKILNAKLEKQDDLLREVLQRLPRRTEVSSNRKLETEMQN